jgi:hypothetical protein
LVGLDSSYWKAIGYQGTWVDTCSEGAEFDGTPDGGGDVLRYTTRKWHGIEYNNSTERTLCQVDFWLTAFNDPSGDGYVYYVEVWTVDGSENLSSEEGQSDNVSANNGWAETQVAFAFSTPVTLSASTEYRILVTRDGDTADSTDYIEIRYDNDTGSTPCIANFVGNRLAHDIDLSENAEDTDDCPEVKLYFQ